MSSIALRTLNLLTFFRNLPDFNWAIPKTSSTWNRVVLMNSFVSRLIIRSPERIFHISRQYDVFSFIIGYLFGLYINLLSNSTDSSFHVKYLSSSKWHSLPGLLHYRRKHTSEHPRITKCIFKFHYSKSRNIS